MIVLVAGTRPNFMKIAPIYRALAARGHDARLLYTGQHSDPSMSDVFFRELELPEPHRRLRVTGATQGEQTASILVGVEAYLMEQRPRVLLVVGDVTSTLASALAAAKLGVPVVHVEAGLRARDWTMPEEVNRVLTDQLSDLLLTPSRDAEPNLLAEGIMPERIRFVGNVMIDSVLFAQQRPTDVLARLDLTSRGYALATLHRPANVDSREALDKTLDALAAIAESLPVLFPVHPRTLARAESFGLTARLRGTKGLRILEPLGHADFVTLLAEALLVATDSGGIQEETTALGVPCLTLRGGTERPITVTEGTNTIVGLDVRAIRAAVRDVREGRGKTGRLPEGWDGKAGERVAVAIEQFLGGSPPPKTAGPRA